MPTNNCSALQKSLSWCQGTPELPGIKRRLYYIAKSLIAKWPTLPKDAQGRPTAAVYQGSFVLVADATWKYIDILPDKSQVTSEAQGEVPSQTQLNKLTAVHPAVGEEASAASAYLNNNDNVFIIEDMKGKYRVIGSDMWNTKTTVAQDLGQGATGTTSTTINAEATDVVPAPFYEGTIETEDGTIDAGNKVQSKPRTARLTLVTTNPTDVLNLVWDFAPFTEQVSLQDPDEVPAIDYNGLTILGAKATDGKDYLYTGGAHFNGAGTAGVRRCIIFTPEWDALLTVTFHSNNSNERRGHIADSELHDLATGDAASGEVSISANLQAGQNYYIWVDNGGGGTISRITYQV